MTSPTEKECLCGCGNALTGRRTKYASYDCQRNAVLRQAKEASKNPHRKCDNCGNALTGRQIRWCSRSCAREFGNIKLGELEEVNRKCTQCGFVKPLEADFYKIPNSESYRRICKSCTVDRNRAPDAKDKKRIFHLKSYYNLTPDQYDAILTHQNGVCAICLRPPRRQRLAVDHDHSSKIVRGLLCATCNRKIIGDVRDSEILYRAAQYIDSPPAVEAVGKIEAPGRKPKKRRKRSRKGRL